MIVQTPEEDTACGARIGAKFLRRHGHWEAGLSVQEQEDRGRLEESLPLESLPRMRVNNLREAVTSTSGWLSHQGAAGLVGRNV